MCAVAQDKVFELCKSNRLLMSLGCFFFSFGYSSAEEMKAFLTCQQLKMERILSGGVPLGAYH